MKIDNNFLKNKKVSMVNKDVLKRIGGNFLAFLAFYAVLMCVLGLVYVFAYELPSDRGGAEEIIRFGISGAEYLEFLVNFGSKPLIWILWILAGAAALVLPTLAFRAVYLEVNNND